MTGAGVESARISAGAVVTLHINSIDTKPLPQPLQGEGKDRRDRPGQTAVFRKGLASGRDNAVLLVRGRSTLAAAPGPR
jgi:hypothetical protein